jgi:tRNA(Arg) A34 adenosine deaminase TadA
MDSYSLWSGLSEPWCACVEEAWAAYCGGSVPIGAAITDCTGRIVARGRNCMYEADVEGYPLSGNRMAHAEMNALLGLAGQEIDHRACTLYTTLEPCPMCIGAARMHAVGEIYYAARDPVAGSAAFSTMTPFMQRWPIAVTGPQDEVLEAVLLALHTEFSLCHGWHWAEVTGQEPACTAGVQLGRRLFESGGLAQRATAGVQVPELLDWLTQQLPRSSRSEGGAT